MKKPWWLNKKVSLSTHHQIKEILRDLNLHTVCEESLCPNISECFGSCIATFMILGDTCTRKCSFCNVKKGSPSSLDYNEPARVKRAVKLLKLRYVVITSPTRDDLDDGGAQIFHQTAKQIKSIDPNIKLEALIPDFLGNRESIKIIANSPLDVVSHNLETVPSLYTGVRKGSDYSRSLDVLRLLKKENKALFTKSGLMLGLGETGKELMAVFNDLKAAGCDFLTLGQYLPPSLSHFPVKEFIRPEKFSYLKEKALGIGFKTVKSSAYIRSSYLAHTFLPKHN